MTVAIIFMLFKEHILQTARDNGKRNTNN